MHISFFDTSAQDQVTLQDLISHSAGVSQLQCAFHPDSLTLENAHQFASSEAICIFVHSAVSEQILEQLPALKVICTMSTGFDHIDVAAAHKRGISICTVPGYGTHTVAEYAFSLILGISRKTFTATRAMKETHSFSITDFEGFDVYGKTIGIVGTGRIGLNVARIAKGFGMRIVSFDLFPNASAAAEIGFEYMNLEQVLSQSDVVSIHVPYTKDTHHLINTDNIMAIKRGAIFINTARGEVVDTQAIVAALDAGLLSGVGLDVLEGERDIADEWQLISSGNEHNQADYRRLLETQLLIDRPEVFVTPHIAFYTREAKHEILKVTVENLNAFMQGQTQNQIPS